MRLAESRNGLIERSDDMRTQAMMRRDRGQPGDRRQAVAQPPLKNCGPRGFADPWGLFTAPTTKAREANPGQRAMTSDEYTPSEPYQAGDLVEHDGRMYRAAGIKSIKTRVGYLAALSDLGLSPYSRATCALLGLSPRQVARYASGSSTGIPGPIGRLLAMYLRHGLPDRID